MFYAAYHMRDGLMRAKRIHDNATTMLTRSQKNKVAIEEEEVGSQFRSFYASLLDILAGAAELEHVLNFDTLARNDAISNLKSYLLEIGIPVLMATPTIETIQLVYKEVSERSGTPRDMESLMGIDPNYWSVKEEFSTNTTSRQLAMRDIDDTMMRMLYRSIQVSTTEDRPINALEFSQEHDAYGQDVINSRHSSVGFPAEFYAAGVPESIRSTFAPCYKKLALGSLKGTVISNEVFDLMTVHIRPELEKPNNNSLYIKKEKNLIRDSSRYLRPEGLLVLTIPYYRMHRDIVVMLAKYYENFQIRKMEGEKFFTNGVILITATKKKTITIGKIEQEAMDLLINVWKVGDIVSILDKPFDPMPLQAENYEIKMFRGSALDKDELVSIYKASAATKSFWKQQKDPNDNSATKNPLLPFNVGQLGLVLTSGSLDGVIDEGYGNYHVVKGRVVKKTNTERDIVTNTGGDQVLVTSTTSNQVEINIMLPDGTHKVLA